MASYEYDDFRVTLTSREDGTYDVRACGPDGIDHAGIFAVPFAADELERAVLQVAQVSTRSSRAAGPSRDVGGAEPPELDAEQLGGALATALLTPEIAAGYDAARQSAAKAGRGLRMTLSLGAAPPLLSLPWELLYRRPRYFANQRQTPLVRQLDCISLSQPPAINSVMRILGVVSGPSDCAPLDGAGERAKVEQAVAEMVALGRVQLDWLETPTPEALRTRLLDDYHVLHYIGHSDFTAEGKGVLYLEDDDGRKAEFEATDLATLLGDQQSLRLVVLNSCEGARTTLTDAYAGVATTLVQLGVPAVVAMQFEISDRAAIVFATELYTSLIGRQFPIDAAVAEARKAIYTDLRPTVEWATPVLFMGDVDVELFHFEVEAAPLPPPAPPSIVVDPAPPPVPPQPPQPLVAPEPPVAKPPRRVGSIVVKVLAGVGVLLVVLLAIGIIVDIADGTAGDPVDDPGTVTTPTTAARAAPTTSSTAGEVVVASVSALAAPLRVTGSIDAPDAVADHPVDLAQDQIVYLRGSGECGINVTYQLLSPSGTALSGAPYVCSDHDRVVAPMSGTYTLQVRSWEGGTGPYDLEVVPVPADDVVEVAMDQPMVGELTVSGEHDVYRFPANAGDVVYLDAAGACGVNVDYVLSSPSGLDLTGAPYVCNDMGRVELPQSGEYTVTVRSWDGGTGPYDVAALSVPPDTVTFVAVGDRLQGELTASGEQHAFLFDAAAGDVVVLEGSGPCGASVDYVLLSPDGVELSGAPYVCNDIGEVELPQTGQYVVLVASFDGGTGPYDIGLRAP